MLCVQLRSRTGPGAAGLRRTRLQPRYTPVVEVCATLRTRWSTSRPRGGARRVDVLGRQVVQKPGRRRSGVIVDKSGYIVTNHHVVGNDAREITVTLFESGRRSPQVPAKLVSSAPKDDLALLQDRGRSRAAGHAGAAPPPT